MGIDEVIKPPASDSSREPFKVSGPPPIATWAGPSHDSSGSNPAKVDSLQVSVVRFFVPDELISL